MVDDHVNSQTVTTCTGPAQVQARQNPSKRRRNKYKVPSLAKKLFELMAVERKEKPFSSIE